MLALQLCTLWMVQVVGNTAVEDTLVSSKGKIGVGILASSIKETRFSCLER
jgi:hypothetical protein